jgi:hypothetical protein
MNEEQCPTCGCTIGGGCPNSTPEEIYSYRSSHPEDYSKEEIQEAKEKCEIDVDGTTTN